MRCGRLRKACTARSRRYKHIFMSGDDQAKPAASGLSRTLSLAALRAAGEATRLRILALLAYGELNVKDLTQDPRPEPAPHQPASEADGRSGPYQALPRRLLGVLPPCRQRRRSGARLRHRREPRRQRLDACPRPGARRSGAEGTRRGSSSLFQGSCRRVGFYPCAARRREGRRGRHGRSAGRRDRSRCSSISAPAPGAFSNCSLPAPGVRSASISITTCSLTRA